MIDVPIRKLNEQLGGDVSLRLRISPASEVNDDGNEGAFFIDIGRIRADAGVDQLVGNLRVFGQDAKHAQRLDPHRFGSSEQERADGIDRAVRSINLGRDFR